MRIRPGHVAIPLLLLATGCGPKTPAAKSDQIPEAGYVVLVAQPVPLEIELAGRATAVETAEVRPQVTGVIKARLFSEGSTVRQGQTLYQIDPAPSQAAVDQAEAALANAQAARIDADAKLARYKPLVARGVVAQQDYADVLAQARATDAQVSQAQAALRAARINLGLTRVPAPISGRIGRSTATTGALATAEQTTPLTTIERLDPMFVDMQQASADYMKMRRQLAHGGVEPASTTVNLVMEDGDTYHHPGRVEFAEAMVDPNTGAVTLRAVFPNPHGALLPGMFVRAKLAQGIAPNALLVPQQAVSRNPRGDATVYVIGPGDKAQQRTVTADRTVGDKWLVTSGVSAGDKVIVEGLARVRPNQQVRPVPTGSPPRAPGAGAGPPAS
jgi:membrane fusion protein (multidrug efflux system)